MGAYSESQGISEVRQEVADFLTERDGYTGDAKNIFLTNGASDGVRLCLQTVLRDPTAAGHYKDGIMTPIPQYPLYSALITLLKGKNINNNYIILHPLLILLLSYYQYFRPFCTLLLGRKPRMGMYCSNTRRITIKS